MSLWTHSNDVNIQMKPLQFTLWVEPACVLVDWVRQISSKWKEALLAGCLLAYVAGASYAFFLVFIEHLKGIRKRHSSLLSFSSLFFPQKSWLHKPVTKVSLSPALISHSTVAVCFLFFPFHKIKFGIFVNILKLTTSGGERL